MDIVRGIPGLEVPPHSDTDPVMIVTLGRPVPLAVATVPGAIIAAHINKIVSASFNARFGT